MEQRYVATELTHFVGRQIAGEADQYELLKKILKSGCLLASPRLGEDGAIQAQTHVGGTKFSNRNMYLSSVVCFCDIPLSDFAIHMGKYSRFGIAFTKEYLLQRGANPVAYVAVDSLIEEQWPPLWFQGGRLSKRDTVSRGKYFDLLMDQYKVDHMIVFTLTLPDGTEPL